MRLSIPIIPVLALCSLSVGGQATDQDVPLQPYASLQETKDWIQVNILRMNHQYLETNVKTDLRSIPPQTPGRPIPRGAYRGPQRTNFVRWGGKPAGEEAITHGTGFPQAPNHSKNPFSPPNPPSAQNPVKPPNHPKNP